MRVPTYSMFGFLSEKAVYCLYIHIVTHPRLRKFSLLEEALRSSTLLHKWVLIRQLEKEFFSRTSKLSHQIFQ